MIPKKAVLQLQSQHRPSVNVIYRAPNITTASRVSRQINNIFRCRDYKYKNITMQNIIIDVTRHEVPLKNLIKPPSFRPLIRKTDDTIECHLRKWSFSTPNIIIHTTDTPDMDEFVRYYVEDRGFVLRDISDSFNVETVGIMKDLDMMIPRDGNRLDEFYRI